ncbi:MAG: hypothetical protein ABSF68_04380 [Candidatus Acidiferrales bacterium]
MKLFSIELLLLTAIASGFGAQQPSQKQAAASDQLGMTCAQILQMSSTDWISHFNGKVNSASDASPGGAASANKPSGETPEAQATLRAIAVYGKCYGARTDRLAASLGKSGKGPLMGVRASFRDFETALNNFTALALGGAQTPADPVKTAFAALYEKQFRYAFYQSYEQKPVNQPPPAPKEATVAPATAAAADQKSSATRITDPMTLAKNRFGDFLAALPEDERHEIHAAFGTIFEKGSIGERWKIEIYRYAIYILESPKDTPFSPPPF